MKIVWKNYKIGSLKIEAQITKYSKGDLKKLGRIYFLWLKLNNLIKKISTRGINIPEAITENAFCLIFTDCVRVVKLKGEKCSYDAINTKTGSKIQIKASSIDEDLTTFGPRSEWDELFFMDFSKGDGSFDIYNIDKKMIYEQKVNLKQTMTDQQELGKRPRFSIKKIIKLKKIMPVGKGSFT